jgi:putative inorganic carbon (hco3(-)) transporter
MAPYVLLYYDVTPKIAVLLAGVAVAAVLASREAPVRSPMLRVFGFLLAAQTLWLAVATAVSKDPEISFGGSAWRRYGLITQSAVLLLAWIVARHAAGRPERVLHLLRAIALAGFPIAIYGILQYLGWDPLIDAEAYHAGEGALAIVRPPSTLGHASYLGTYLLTVIFAGVVLVLVEESQVWRILGAAAGAVGTAALILTGTRAAILALLCGAILLSAWLRPKIGMREIIAVLAAVALLAGFYFSPAGHLLRSRTRWSMEDSAGGGRLLLWRDSIRMAAARWLVGFGPETFSIWFPRFQSAELAREYPTLYQESPHNVFLDALVDEGLPGAGIFMAVTAVGFYAAWKARGNKVMTVLGAALTALLVSQQFTVFTATTAVFFYITIALLVAQTSKAEYLPVERHRTVRLIGAGLVAVVFLTFAGALVYVDVGLARVNYLSYFSRIRDAVARYQQVERWRPPGMRTDLWYSRAIARAARKSPNPADASLALQQGLEAAQRAVENAEERENAWLNLAVFYGRQNDYAHTEQSLRAAIDCAPNSYKPHWLLAEVLWTGKRLSEASVEAEKAADLNGGKDPEVTRTLTEIRAALKNSQP